MKPERERVAESEKPEGRAEAGLCECEPKPRGGERLRQEGERHKRETAASYETAALN